jgi:hypothetical protein
LSFTGLQKLHTVHLELFQALSAHGQVEIIPSIHAGNHHLLCTDKLVRSTLTAQLVSTAFSGTSKQLEYKLQQWFASREIHTCFKQVIQSSSLTGRDKKVLTKKKVTFQG